MTTGSMSCVSFLANRANSSASGHKGTSAELEPVKSLVCIYLEVKRK